MRNNAVFGLKTAILTPRMSDFCRNINQFLINKARNILNYEMGYRPTGVFYMGQKRKWDTVPPTPHYRPT